MHNHMHVGFYAGLGEGTVRGLAFSLSTLSACTQEWPYKDLCLCWMDLHWLLFSLGQATTLNPYFATGLDPPGVAIGTH